VCVLPGWLEPGSRVRREHALVGLARARSIVDLEAGRHE
jgi:hypothetical protein